jgi:predicted nuclease of predicted toxin-antitoxin system
VRLLLDEMLSPQIARNLRERGHDVMAIKERAEWVSLHDDEVTYAPFLER